MFTINEKPKNAKELLKKVPCGFQMTFDNGNTISIQFGWGNYSQNNLESKSSCIDCEVAIWNNQDQFFKFPNGNSIVGFCTPDEVAEYIKIAKTQTFNY